MIEDDDIPVLTQILRTGDPRDRHVERAPTSALAAAVAPLHDFDVRPLDPKPIDAPLVIGNEPQVDRTTSHEQAARPVRHREAQDPTQLAISGGAREARGGDSFRSPQDQDPALEAETTDARHDDREIGSAPARSTIAAAPEPPERRLNPFASEEPRERRQEVGDVSLQRLASITSSVRDSVLIALQTRIDTELDARIAQAMHREVETAIAHLQDKLREGLTDALRDVVARAVDDEMTRFVAVERDAAARLDPRKPPGRFEP